MSRQVDVKSEERETKRRDQLVKVLEYGLVGALEAQGIELLGFAFKYDAFNSLMTIKAIVGGDQSVCFVGSDSVMNCFLKAYSEARRGALRWRADKYRGSGT
jgi:hypothetical protein